MTPSPTTSKQLVMPTPVPDVDSSRLSQFSMRLNELVNRAFVTAKDHNVPTMTHTGTSPFTGQSITVPRIQHIIYGSNHLPNRVCVIEMTRTVVDELHNAESVDPYLLRAVSRTILKAVSHFVSRIESQLVSWRIDPTSVQIPLSVRGLQNIPAAMEFNLALISLEWIVEESLERCLEGLPPLAILHSPNLLVPTAAEGLAKQPMPPFVHDILSPLREKMEASIIHVVQPLLVNIKSSLTSCILRASPTPFQPRHSPPVRDLEADGNAPKGPWYKDLEERLDAVYRLLMLRIVDRCGRDGQAWFISVAIHTIWKGLVAITSRSVFAPASVVNAEFVHTFGRTSGNAPSSAVLNSLLANDPSSRRVPTPTQLAHALRSVSRTNAHRHTRMFHENESGTQTPVGLSGDFEAWRGHFALPVGSEDCYVINPLLVADQLHDLQVFERLMRQFCSNFPESSHEEAPDETDNGDEDLAREALREAFAALGSTIIVLRTLLQDPDALQHLGMCRSAEQANEEAPLSPAALKAFQVIPALLLIHIAYCRIPPGWPSTESSSSNGLQLNDKLPTPPELFNYSWSDYESALPGFGAGEGAAQSLVDRYGILMHDLFQQMNRSHAEMDDAQAVTEYDDASEDSADEVPVHLYLLSQITTQTLAHMQRDALNVFESVLRHLQTDE
ncbi:hypothetical protein MEQU1_000074 [Malassezia equina]|uniref:Uncharacterized protein n=1 Tax=Malassezia equina TaxID=1381935 RepID=A0AAF0EBE0_9BASI|nr:hypothetical protein MEQU1_000074 [Malassezia equina]